MIRENPTAVFAAFSDELNDPFSKAAKTFPCAPSLYTVKLCSLSNRWGPLHPCGWSFCQKRAEGRPLDRFGHALKTPEAKNHDLRGICSLKRNKDTRFPAN
jgi:hypothetical protein